MQHQLPHGPLVQHVVGEQPHVPVCLKIAALKIDQFRRIDAGDGVQIKVAHTCPAHKVSQHPAVLSLVGADAVAARIVPDRQRLEFPDHPDGFLVRLPADGWLIRLLER